MWAFAHIRTVTIWFDWWFGDVDSNHDSRIQSPLSYRWTIPECLFCLFGAIFDCLFCLFWCYYCRWSDLNRQALSGNAFWMRRVFHFATSAYLMLYYLCWIGPNFLHLWFWFFRLGLSGRLSFLGRKWTFHSIQPRVRLSFSHPRFQYFGFILMYSGHAHHLSFFLDQIIPQTRNRPQGLLPLKAWFQNESPKRNRCSFYFPFCDAISIDFVESCVWELNPSTPTL